MHFILQVSILSKASCRSPPEYFRANSRRRLCNRSRSLLLGGALAVITLSSGLDKQRWRGGKDREILCFHAYTYKSNRKCRDMRLNLYRWIWSWARSSRVLLSNSMPSRRSVKRDALRAAACIVCAVIRRENERMVVEYIYISMSISISTSINELDGSDFLIRNPSSP